MNVKVAVIGAGPAGLSASYELSKAGCSVDLYEASDGVGGMCRSLKLWGHTVDLGPHRFFSKNKRVNKLWLEVIHNEFVIVERKTRIYYRNKFLQYPINFTDLLKSFGIFEASRCGLSYLKVKLTFREASEQNTFENFFTKRFGKRIYNHFFKSYTEKVWGLSCDHLSADFAQQRIKDFSLTEVVRHFFTKRVNTHKTLVERFLYPAFGTGSLYEKMKEMALDLGCEIKTSTSVDRVEFLGRDCGYRVHTSGSTKDYDYVISSMPLNILVGRLNNCPGNVVEAANLLKFRDTALVYLLIDREDVFQDQWIYIHSSEFRMGRITNYRNWSKDLYPDKNTVIAVEYWGFAGDELISAEDDVLIQKAKVEMSEAGFISKDEILDAKVLRISKCYPIYDLSYSKNLEIIKNYLTDLPGLIPIGRYGSFKYNNQDHSLLMGVLAAEKILNNTNVDLWKVNSESSDYHEENVMEVFEEVLAGSEFT